MLKKGAIIAIVIPSIVVLTFGIMTGTSYNSLVKADHQVDLKQATIKTALAQRNSTIDQLIVAADAYLDHESDIYSQITDARSNYTSAISGDSLSDLIASDGDTSLAITNLLAVFEDNPAIRGDSVIQGLMATMETQEWSLRNARDGYNDAATDFNTKIQLFPNIIFAKMFGYSTLKPLWEMSSGEDIVITFPS